MFLLISPILVVIFTAQNHDIQQLNLKKNPDSSYICTMVLICYANPSPYTAHILDQPAALSECHCSLQEKEPSRVDL